MNDDELQRQLRGLVPEPGPSYWDQIDSMLEGVEAERNVPSNLGRIDVEADTRDTDAKVIRLTDMSNRREGRVPSGRLMLMSAAAIVVVAAFGAILLANQDPAIINAADTGTSAVTLPDTDTNSADSAADRDGESTANDAPGTDDSQQVTDVVPESVGPVASTQCFYQDAPEDFVGQIGLRLVVYESGAVTAIQRFVDSSGTESVTASTGFILDEDGVVFSMQQVPGSGDTTQQSTRAWSLWSLDDDGSFLETSDAILRADGCAEVDEFLTGIPAPTPVVPGSTEVNPVLAPGRHCFDVSNRAESTFGVSANFLFEIEVVADNTVSIRSFDYDTELVRVDRIDTGSGRFVSDEDIAIIEEIWEGSALYPNNQMYAVIEGALQPAAMTGPPAEPVNCSKVDALFVTDFGFEIASDETLEFEAGSTSGTVSGGFIRGEAHLYRLEARKGQTLRTMVSLAERNAVLALYTPDGLLIQYDDRGFDSTDILLPVDGVYDLLISGIRGNVSYTVTVEIN